MQTLSAPVLSVTPQGTEAYPPPEEMMQQEAQQEGWLSVWHEFTWWYPWYRLHLRADLGNFTVDVGFNPIIPWGVTYSWTGMEWLAEMVAEVAAEIWQDIMLDFVGLFLSYILAKGLSLWNLAAGLLVEAIKGTVQYGFLYLDWNNSMKMLAQAIANFIMGFVALQVSIAEAFLDTIFKIVYGPTMSFLYLMSNKMITAAQPLQATRSLIDYVEAGIDFSVGIFAFLRYSGRI